MISNNSSKLNSAICDDRYCYIIDFMNEVINYRLDKEDFSISLEEMMILADNFIQSYKRYKLAKFSKMRKK